MKYLSLIVLLAVVQAPRPLSKKVPGDTVGTAKQKTNEGPSRPAGSVGTAPNQHADQEPSPPANPKQIVEVDKLPTVSTVKDWMDKTAWCFGLVLVVVGVLGVRAAYKTLKAIESQASLMQGQLTQTEGLARQAVRQTELTQAELELSHRPWISVDLAPASPLMFDERGCVLMFKVTMTNVGHSVAKHVSLWTQFAITGLHDPMEVRDKLCGIMKRHENEKSDYGSLLFPKQILVEHRPVISAPQDVQKALDLKVFSGLNAIGLHVVGCVDYQSALDPTKHHQTRFVHIVGYVDPAKGTVMGAFDPAAKAYANMVVSPMGHGAEAD